MGALPALIAFMAMNATPENFVTSESVAVEGGLIAAVSADSRGVRAFRGIPYAAPPIGDRRWRAPAPVEPWPGVRRSDRFGAPCAQAGIFALALGDAPSHSEDCLHLNVWTAARDTKERLPVLVWIPGGAYVDGSGSEPRYDGAALAARGLVVVTINYRLGVFGFLSHPELTSEAPQRASGNYGLMDQIAALQWVQRHIAAFGGDPARVAIGGNSAGATSVNILMVSPLARGLFQRVIAHGGSAMSASAPNDGSPLPREVEEQKGLQFAHAVGAKDIRELRALSMDTLVKASGPDWSTWAWNASVDGHVLPAAPAELFARQLQNDVPLLVGWNANEGAAIGRATFGDDDESFAEQITARFGASAPEVLRLYPAGTSEEERASKAALAGDGFIVYPAWTWALAQERNGKQPVYVYKFAHRPPLPPGYGRDSMLGDPGAFHGAELAYLFGNFPLYRDWRFGPVDRRLSDAMQAYWVRFVQHGDPNGADAPAWPAYQGADPQQLRIDASGLRAASDADRKRLSDLGRLAQRHPGSLSYRDMDVTRWTTAPRETI